MTEQTRPAAPRIAYFVSEYPATSHTFILREVLGLRQRGFEIATASINADSRPLSAVTAEERDERETTYVLKSHGVRGAVAAQIWSLWRHPRGYGRGLAAALLPLNLPRSTVTYTPAHSPEYMQCPPNKTHSLPCMQEPSQTHA
jgi:hypothetical protein